MSDLVELKPCPFCGSDELSHGWSAPGYDGSMSTGNVECHSCNALVYANGGESDAIAAWNARAEAARIEALEREIAAAKEKEARLREALDIADRLIERGYGIDVPPEWDRAFRRCLPHSAALSDGGEDV